MKINFNMKNSIAIKDSALIKGLLSDLFRDYCKEHDMSVDNDTYMLFFSPGYIKNVAEYLSSRGWQVSHWKVGNARKPTAWGLNIEDSCPIFVEEKFKRLG